MSDYTPEQDELFTVIETAHRGAWTDATEYADAPTAFAPLSSVGLQSMTVKSERMREHGFSLSSERVSKTWPDWNVQDGFSTTVSDSC